MADFDFTTGFDPSRLPQSARDELERLERTVHLSAHRAVIAYHSMLLLAGSIHRGDVMPLPRMQAEAFDLAAWAFRLSLSESGVTVPQAKPIAPLSS